jgi:GxxExxY protein
MVQENFLSEKIIGCCIAVHKLLGPGLLESVCETALIYELTRAGLRCDRQKEIPVNYDDITLPVGFRADIIVEDKVLIELKSVEKVLPLHWKQVLTYLRVAN